MLLRPTHFGAPLHDDHHEPCIIRDLPGYLAPSRSARLVARSFSWVSLSPSVVCTICWTPPRMLRNIPWREKSRLRGDSIKARK